MIQGFHHFAIIASSEDCIHFYEKLGFSIYFRKERKNDVVVLMKGYDIEIEMIIDPSHPKKPSIEPLGLRHVALKVDNIEETIESLQLSIGSILNDWTGTHYVFITDPDGNQVELHE